MNLRETKKGVYYSTNNIRKIDENIINLLNKKALEINHKMVRLCLHSNEQKNLMSMLILVRDKYIYPPHKHNWKDEVYSIIKGSCVYREFDEKGNQLISVDLCEGQTLLNHNKNFHLIKPLSNLFCFLETTTGPFKDNSIEYLDLEKSDF